MAEHRATIRRGVTRTRSEYLRAVVVGFAIAFALVATLGGVLVLVTGTAAHNLAGYSGLHTVNLGSVLAVAGLVGLGAAATVAVLARPRVVLAGDGDRVGEHSGFGQPWAGTAGPAVGGTDSHDVAPDVTQ